MFEELSRSAATPTPSTALCGREAELLLVLGLLNTESVRLVTITGPSGIGKSIVAEEATNRMRSVSSLLLRKVDLREVEGIEEARSLVRRSWNPGPPERRNLLLVDGADSSREAPSLIAQALDRDPGLHVLATSVSPLKLKGEHLVPLGSLALPTAGVRDEERALASPAVRLFCTRMRAADPTFTLNPASAPTVVELCIALDGMPLALELAAMRCATIGVEDFLDLYRSSGVDALSSHPHSAGDRHGSLPRAIEWTCSSLPTSARLLLRQLTTFVGGFNWPAVVAVATHEDFAFADGPDEVRLANDLGSLVSTGLVRKVDPNDQRSVTRYTIPGPVRQFLVEHDDEGDRAKLRRRHAEYFRELARRSGEGRLSFGGGNWDQELMTDQENLSAALAYFESEVTVQDALPFAVDLEGMWMGVGAAHRGADHLSRLLEVWLEGDDIPPDPVLGARGLGAWVGTGQRDWFDA